MNLRRLLLVCELGCTVFMTGVIWFVQVVHYPLFALVGDGYAGYQAAHMTRTTWVVGAPMLAELASSVALFWLGPRTSGRWVGLALLGAIWAATWGFSVPLHEILARGFDANAHERLVTTNWIRTLAWTARAVLLLGAAARTPRGAVSPTSV